MSIPKIIHYCWFGENSKPKLSEKCFKSWKKHCPDYEIIEWNEDNFDISSCPLYVRQAYEAKKWAFVTDYVRLKVVFDHGGIYLDTDVELLKNLDFLLDNNAYFGFEGDRFINTGLGFGANKGTPILRELMEDYEDIPFILNDGSYDSTACPARNTEVFIHHNLIQNDSKQILNDGILILPTHVFSPISYETGLKNIKDDTVSIHHFSGSWQSTDESNIRKKRISKYRRKEILNSIIHIPNTILQKVFGKEKYSKLKSFIKGD